MARRGRRPGDQGAREEILTAARALFIEDGFNKATVTGVARRAGVDGALVYHYFGTKVDLFIEAVAGLHRPIGSVTDGRVRHGAEVVSAFLRQWEQGPEQPGQAFVALAQAASGSPEAAASLRQFVTDRIWAGLPGQERADDGRLSPAASKGVAMIGAQLLGIAWARYILEFEPLASASIDDVASWFGPTIDSCRSVQRDRKPTPLS